MTDLETVDDPAQAPAPDADRQTSEVNYSGTPTLRAIAEFSRRAPSPFYLWGLESYEKYHGDIDAMMRAAMNYAVPPADTGVAEVVQPQADNADEEQADAPRT